MWRQLSLLNADSKAIKKASFKHCKGQISVVNREKGAAKARAFYVSPNYNMRTVHVVTGGCLLVSAARAILTQDFARIRGVGFVRELAGKGSLVDSVIPTLIYCIDQISRELRAAHRVSLVGTSNAFGDDQLNVDVLAERIIRSEIAKCPSIVTASSEEDPTEQHVGTQTSGQDAEHYSLAFDPLDGSSIIAPNWTVGTIVGVWKGSSALHQRPTDGQVAAILGVYGPRTTAIVALRSQDGRAVSFEVGLGEDKETATCEILRPGVDLLKPPFKTRYFAPANLRAAAEDDKYRDLVMHYVMSKYTLRYSGGLVPDIIHTLVKGHGIYISPVTDKSKAKLRRLYELAPIALIIEGAGGVAVDAATGRSVLETSIEDCDERAGIICGTAEEVAFVVKAFGLATPVSKEPDATALIGRPENGVVHRYINNKSVSRKHLTIEVADAPKSDSGLVQKRTELRLTDDSKVGTKVDDQTITKETKVLGGSERDRRNVYEVRLGRYETVFKFEWVDIVLTCNQLKKKKVSGPDTLEEKRSQLEGSDIKVVTEWLGRESTHVVSKKRNTPTVLQALLQARWVVGYEFVDALANAVTRPTPETNCLLEEDFDAHWPKEADYGVPPKEGEEDPGNAMLLLPNVERSELFTDYTFVFLKQEQFDNLMPAVTSGGGKAVLCEAQAGQTDKVIAYVRELAGKKDDSAYRLSQYTGGGGIVIVRSNQEHGRNEINAPIEVGLDQRAIEQSELMDVVLTLDTSLLTRRLPERSQSMAPEVNGDDEPIGPGTLRSQRSQRMPQQVIEDAPEDRSAGSQPPTSAQPAPEPQQEPGPGPEPEPEQARPVERPAEQQSTIRKQPRWKRQPFKSTFEGFGDFDVSQFAPAPTQQSDMEPPNEDSVEPSEVHSEKSMDVDSTSQTVNGTQRSTRKRPAPSQEPEDAEEEAADYLQGRGQEALKRRKTEAAKAAVSSFSRVAVEADKATQEKAAPEKRRKEKQIDVKAELAKRREEEEERRRKDEEALKELHGIDPSELKDLAKIETFDIPVREHAPSQAAGQRSERWNPKWDGRKNFKKFRPKGQRANVNVSSVTGARRVIVTLEEVPRRGHGLGDEYWLETEAENPCRNRGRKSQNKSQSQSHSARSSRAAANDDDEDSAGFHRRIQRSREEDAEQEALESLGAEELRAARSGGKSQASSTHPTSTMSQTLGTESQRKAPGKRPAAEQGGPVAKKAKAPGPRQSGARSAMVAAEVGDEDDDEDGDLKFRRRGRR
ncbi:Sedoheptulose-1,7-bisphosphatase [Teratosphaeria destructans]|uniref:Sedoheptulose-1,7-bisphosphatase n=1 Tax=Teratosphaeria destructans TaxID=418781 RepID=A0A9W7SMJ2_9PEZI|nr:Sedoheptulose-1,7-bisphosphatase [Teratosphaeria destructans]